MDAILVFADVSHAVAEPAEACVDSHGVQEIMDGFIELITGFEGDSDTRSRYGSKDSRFGAAARIARRFWDLPVGQAERHEPPGLDGFATTPSGGRL
jgi:hypothetical protein